MQRRFALLALLLLLLPAPACSWLRAGRQLEWQIALQINAPASERDAAVKQTVIVLKRRLDLLGLSNFEIQSQDAASTGRILVKIPDAADRQRMKYFLTVGGRLELRGVLSPPSAQVQTYPTKNEAANVAIGSDGDATPYQSIGDSKLSFLLLEKTPVVGGEDLRSARALERYPGNYSVRFTLNPGGAERLKSWTRTHINHYLAVVLDGTAVSTAFIKGEIGDTGEITGRFTKIQAEDLALSLNSGALPAVVSVISEGPSH